VNTDKNYLKRDLWSVQACFDVRTGLAKEKKRLKETLIALAADNSRKIMALAKITTNEALMDEANFSISYLGRISDIAFTF
jgi:hypothetical protein